MLLWFWITKSYLHRSISSHPSIQFNEWFFRMRRISILLTFLDAPIQMYRTFPNYGYAELHFISVRFWLCLHWGQIFQQLHLHCDALRPPHLMSGNRFASSQPIAGLSVGAEEIRTCISAFVYIYSVCLFIHSYIYTYIKVYVRVRIFLIFYWITKPYLHCSICSYLSIHFNEWFFRCLFQIGIKFDSEFALLFNETCKKENTLSIHTYICMRACLHVIR